MLKGFRNRDTTYTLDENSSYYEIESLYQSRLYSSKYWMARSVLEPDNEDVMMRLQTRLVELDDLKQRREAARLARAALRAPKTVIRPLKEPKPPKPPKPPKGPRIRAPRVRPPRPPRPPRPSRSTQEWVLETPPATPSVPWTPPPLSWD